MTGRNRQTIRQRLKTYRYSPLSFVLFVGVCLAAMITVGILLALVGYILYKGIPHLSWSLFAWEYTSENVSMMPAIINTILMTALSLLIAVPLGIVAAIYLVEYARRGNKLVTVIRITAETLSGIPSIVYGLFGYLLFVTPANAVTLCWRAPPWHYDSPGDHAHHRGGAERRPRSLPGGQFWPRRRPPENRVSNRASLRDARHSGGHYLVHWPHRRRNCRADLYGRHRGADPDNLLDSGRTLSVHMYALWNEGLSTEPAYATGVVLLGIVILINMLSGFLAKKVSAR